MIEAYKMIDGVEKVDIEDFFSVPGTQELEVTQQNWADKRQVCLYSMNNPLVGFTATG